MQDNNEDVKLTEEFLEAVSNISAKKGMIQSAMALGNLHRIFVQAGFTREEALQIIISIIK